jgi:ferredoxin
MKILDRNAIDPLFEALKRRGFALVGPTVRDGAIVYDEIGSSTDLPVGWTDEQAGGTYRLKRRADDALFGYAVGPQSWKKYLLLPAMRLWEARREKNGFRILTENAEPPRLAFIGVRSCELQAIAVQDHILIGGPHQDPSYRLRRDHVFLLAVNCGQAGGTCFCVSMKTGPKATSGFDLALTEIMEPARPSEGEGRHYFVAEAGTERGAELLRDVPHSEAAETEIDAALRVVHKTASEMGRTLDTAGIKNLLYQNLEHPRWDEVATRCLTCANCTMVCPTCFCTTVEDVTDLSGDHAERWRKWDSCFTMDFSYIHGGTVRPSAKSRYRQWMTHKLATWIDQFGTSGCVGCGRCITWCPVGIDITEEVRAIREAKK